MITPWAFAPIINPSMWSNYAGKYIVFSIKQFIADADITFDSKRKKKISNVFCGFISYKYILPPFQQTL